MIVEDNYGMSWSAEYLKASRTALWNTDYMEFLVKYVWKILKPVNIIDFGCGIGFLGMMLMPILPEGSTYTGVDINKDLLQKADKAFKNSPFEVSFVSKDLLEYESVKRYDIAVCQTVLQHIHEPQYVLKKMIDSVASGGKVICIELDSVVSNAAMYFSDLDLTKLGFLTNLQKLIMNEIKNGGSDKGIGLKIPIMMQELGLRDIDIRVNDHVHFVNPKENEELHLYKAKGFEANPFANKQKDKDTAVTELINRGLSPEEAEHQYHCQVAISEHIEKSLYTSYFVNSLCLFISYGTV